MKNKLFTFINILGYTAGFYFIIMVAFAAYGCVINPVAAQKQMGYILIVSVTFLLAAMIFMLFKKRLIASAISIIGWASTLYVGINLTNSSIVTALQELPNDKFFLCHLLPVVIPIFCVGMFVFYKIKQKKEDTVFFMKTQKDAEERYKSILE